MRPVDRGPAPQKFTKYGEAISDLETRLGTYCSYCESRLPSGLAVEHMAPKSLCQKLELEWTNFLLGCGICNSVKGKTNVLDNDVLWPDRNNTALAITYSDGGFVGIADDLSDELRKRTHNLIELVGLDRHAAAGWPTPSPRDKRWSEREKIWKIAEMCLLKYENLGKNKDALFFVIEAAKGYGFFSVWLSVFKEYSAVLIELVSAFPGTAQCCFNQNGDPVPRPNAAI